jgi:hypothetical protein
MKFLIRTGLVVFLIFSSPCLAMEYAVPLQSSGTIAEARGEVRPGDSEKLERFLKQHPRVQTLSLHSPGGKLGEGIKIGMIVREAKLATLVQSKASCASACVFIFAGGVIRESKPGAKIIVHMASRFDNVEYIARLKEILLMPNFDLDTRVRVIMLENEQNSAKALTAQADYLQKMGISLRLLFEISGTSHLEGNELSIQKMRDLNLVNVN